MRIGKDLFTTDTHRIVPVYYTEGDCEYLSEDTKSYYGFVKLPGYVPLTDSIGTKESLIKRLDEIKSTNPSYMQMKNWIIANL